MPFAVALNSNEVTEIPRKDKEFFYVSKLKAFLSDNEVLFLM